MPHSKSPYQAEQGQDDGILIVGPEDIMISGTATRTRNAAGDWSINVGASQAVLFGINVGQFLQRTGVTEKFLEQFGGSNPSLDAGKQGIYGTDFTGNPISVRTSYLKKGLKLLGFKTYYLIGTNDLTTHTCRVDSVLYPAAAVPTIAAVLASGANGLTTAVTTGKSVSVSLAAAEQIYRTTDMQELVIEIAATTPAGGTYRLYRVELLVGFNLQ